MTGGPGVGKTTIVKAILRVLAAKGTGLLLCAPTGRAAKRMTEATGFEAKTIHRLLEVDPKGGGFRRGEGNRLDCDLLVVDEALGARSARKAGGNADGQVHAERCDAGGFTSFILRSGTWTLATSDAGCSEPDPQADAGIVLWSLSD
jgi:hypothetical protein